MDIARLFAQFGAWIVVGAVAFIFLDGLTLFWGARTCRVPDSTFGKGILSGLVCLIASTLLNFIPFPIGLILGLVVQWLIIMGIFSTSFGKGVAIWFLGLVYLILLSIPIGIVVALVVANAF